MRESISIADFLARVSEMEAQLVTRVQQWSRQSNQETVIVGGVVRNYLLGRPIKDIDIMSQHPVSGLVDYLKQTESAAAVFHPTFLTYAVSLPSGVKVDIVTAREETYEQPGALPTVVTSSLTNDFKRRDFTVNSMACRLGPDQEGLLMDPLNGQADLEKKLIRILHDKSFEDDPTRIYRAARFAARYDFNVESKTQKLIDQAIDAQLPVRLSPVRRRHEFELILKEQDPRPSLKLIDSWGALRLIHPDWKMVPLHEECFGVPTMMVGENLLIERLCHWFRPWPKSKVEEMMTALSFERKVKKEVLGAMS